LALITDYASLVTATTDTLNRSDLSAFVPNYLQAAQSKLYKNLRIRAMETALNLTTVSGVAAIPATYLELKFAYVNAAPVNMIKRTSPQQIYTQYPDRTVSTTRPTLIATEGTNFIFGGVPSDGVNIKGIYYARLTLLSGSNTTNWFITDAPDVLLYGGLLEAEPFLGADERALTWKALYDLGVQAIIDEEKRQQASGGGLQTMVG
jgi:hypothetical protein